MTSYTALGEHGFWCSDTLLEVFAHLLADLLATKDDEVRWPDEYLQHLRFLSQTPMNGCVDLKLPSLEQKLLVDLANRAKEIASSVETDPSAISADALNAAGLGPMSTNIDPSPVRKLCDVLARLVTGHWEWTAADAEALPSYWLKAPD